MATYTMIVQPLFTALTFEFSCRNLSIYIPSESFSPGSFSFHPVRSASVSFTKSFYRPFKMKTLETHRFINYLHHVGHQPQH